MYLTFGIFVFVFGTIIGSFLNVVIWRLPREEGLNGRSHCPHCRHKLAAADLVPLLSFAMLGRKCRYCNEPISPRYFIIELVTGLLYVTVFVAVRPIAPASVASCVEFLAVTAFLIPIFVIDMEHYLVLDVLVFPALILVTAAHVVLDVLLHHAFLSPSSQFVSGLLGASAGTLPFYLTWFFSKGEWMGFGDVKLMLLLGSVAGLQVVGITVLMAVLAGGVVATLLLFFGGKTLKSKIPFGTFLTAASFITMLWGEKVLHWYLALLGF